MKVAIVTGASRGGIGRAVVDELKRNEYFVYEVSKKL